jgi:membrane fusion protein (multidrug efflux system)
MKRMKKFIFSVLFLTTSLLAQNPMHRKMPTPHVDVFEVKPPQKIKIDNLIYPAQTKAYEYVTVIAKVNGTLQKEFFKEGDFVKKDEILFKIDDSIYQAKVEAALANLDMAKANLYKAKKDWERAKKLYAKHSISQKERDAAFSAYNSALASLENAKANLKLAKINLDYTDVKAPISGITTVKKVDIGNYVTIGTPLVDIYNIDKIYVYFSLPESDFEKLKNLYEVDGKLKVDILKNNKIVAEGLIDYKDKKLLPGDFVKVRLSNVYKNNAVLIPQKALLQNQKGMVVFVAQNGVVEVRPIFAIKEYEDKFIVKGLVKPGDKVIVNNFFRIKPGAKIIVDKIINKE